MKPRPPIEKQAVEAAEGGAHARAALPPYETIALVLQGGGALGSYQAGVFEGLYDAGIPLNWIAGISIGALNTAVIAGNKPGHRRARLREFWERICEHALFPALPTMLEYAFFNSIDPVRKAFTTAQAMSTVLQGQRGFFVPRVPAPLPATQTPPERTSYYDTGPLRETLLEFCDFDRINSGEMRVSVGAVNVGTGNFVYFDNTTTKLRPEHFMASGALPPAFPPVEIDGEYYWDGGLVSNTPLAQILHTDPRRDTLVFQVDLWNARGPVPTSLNETAERTKDIQYSSRTRYVTTALQREQRYRRLLRNVLDQVPEAARDNEWCKQAAEMSCSKRYNVQLLIYHEQKYEQHFKDYQFGLSTMQAHWEAGLNDIRRSLAVKGALDMPTNKDGFVTHDIHRTDYPQ